MLEALLLSGRKMPPSLLVFSTNWKSLAKIYGFKRDKQKFQLQEDITIYIENN